MGIQVKGNDFSIQGRMAMGVKGITLNEGDEVITALPIRDPSDDFVIFTKNGNAKRTSLKEIPTQNRGGKGLIIGSDNLATVVLANDEDNILISGDKNSICISCKELPKLNRSNAIGNAVIKNSIIASVTKI